MVKFISLLPVLLSLKDHSNKLISYYNGELNLTNDQVILICDSLIHNSQSDYLLALAYYQKAWIADSENDTYKAYELLTKSQEQLVKSDTVDNYLHYSILNKLGLILKYHWLVGGAAEKFRQALEPAFAYSLERGLSVKYNLARALAYKDPEEAMNLLVDILHESKKNRLNDRVAKTYNEIALILVRSKEHLHAIDYFNMALEYAEDTELRGMTYQNYSHLYYEMGKYDLQRKWLNRSLELGDHRNRFISLMDMGENCLIKGDKLEAMEYLLEAEELYQEKPLRAKYIKVFEWLAKATEDEKRRSSYYKKRGDDMQKVIDVQEQLEAKLKQQAMRQFLMRMESDRKAERTKDLLFYLGIISTIVILGMVVTWRLWWYRLRVRLASKLKLLADRWDQME